MNEEYRDELLIYGIKPIERVPYTPEYIKYDKLFSPPECQSIIDFGLKQNKFQIAGVGNSEPNQYKIDTKYRMVKSMALEPTEVFDWLYKKLLRHVVWTNKERFQFDLSGVNEQIQLLWYQHQENISPDELPEGSVRAPGHYNQHQDVGGGYSSLRKLSVTVQLSPGDSYEGCDLHLLTHRDICLEERKQGDMIIFPSYLPHYVSDITKGERFSLVVWVSGPPFR